MPRIGGEGFRPPGAHPEPPPQQTTRPPAGPQGTHEPQPRHGGPSWTTLSPAGMSGGRVVSGHAGRSTGWRESYALPRLPDAYVSTADAGVFKDAQSGQAFIFHDYRAYAVMRAPNSPNWVLTTPGNPLERGGVLQRSAGGDWILHGDSAGPAGAGTGSERTSPAQLSSQPGPLERMTEFMLRYPGADASAVARSYGASGDEIRQIAAKLAPVVQAWHALQQGGVQIRPSVIVGPLTERERQFVQKWRSTLPTSRLATIMDKPTEVIDAFVRAHRRPVTAPPPQPLTHGILDNLARAEWKSVADADVSGGHRPPRVAYTEQAMKFVERWRGELSDRSLSILMTLPGETLEQLAQQSRSSPQRASVATGTSGAAGAENRPLSAQPEPSRALLPQPGPSGHQGPLTNDQEAQIMELSEWGMSPPTIAMYIGKPREAINTFLDSVARGSHHQ